MKEIGNMRSVFDRINVFSHRKGKSQCQSTRNSEAQVHFLSWNRISQYSAALHDDEKAICIRIFISKTLQWVKEAPIGPNLSKNVFQTRKMGGKFKQDQPLPATKNKQIY